MDTETKSNGVEGKTTISLEEQVANKSKIISLLLSTHRPGIEKLIAWLENKTDFFTAPASSKYHLDCEGGLALHSLNVYRCLLAKIEAKLINIRLDSVIITSLMHDLCKINFYVPEVRNVRDGSKVNSMGKEVPHWVEKRVWVIKDTFPVGHGEKSCYYLQSYIRLTEEEYAMIRLHMGSDRSTYPDPFAQTAEIYPGVVALHTADSEAAFIVEHRV